MKVISLIEQVKDKMSFLNGVRINDITQGIPVSVIELEQIENSLGIVFPDLLRDLYLNDSDGIVFSWSADNKVYGQGCNIGVVNILSPKEILFMYNDMRSIVEESEANEEEMVGNPGLQALVNDWRYWVPVVWFPNGDAFCIEKRDNANSIVFLEHDVMDGGPNLHGLKIASNFEELMVIWSRINFVDIYDWTLGVNEKGIDLSKEIFASLVKDSTTRE